MNRNISTFLAQNKQNIAYGLGSFASSILGTLFSLFNVAFFTKIVRLNPKYFYAGHILYGIWNAVNDPIFGWIIDHIDNRSNRRLPIIKYGGPLWSICFMVTWYPWTFDGESHLAAVHFLFTMFCYDGFLTFVLIVKCALLADLCTGSLERNKLNVFSAWFGLVGSSLATVAYFFWDEQNLTTFRQICWIFCAVAGFSWFLSGHFMTIPNSTMGNVGDDVEFQRVNIAIEKIANNDNFDKKSSSWAQEFIQWFRFVIQLMKQKNFILYVSMNWMMNFSVTLSNSFFVFFDKLLMSKVMPRYFYLTVMNLCLYLPKFGVQIMTPYANKFGLYGLIMLVTKALCFTGMISLMAGQDQYFMWGILIICQMFLFSSWGFYDLIMADVIDEDKHKWKRKESVSVSMHGIQSLFVKPSQSLAPILGVWILSVNGLQHDGQEATQGTELILQSAIFRLTFVIPLICTGIQYAIWRHYDLHGNKLKQIKYETTE